MNIKNIIEVNHISKVYKLYKNPQDQLKELFSIKKKKYHTEYKALSDISFSVKKGETLGIIGKNGAGKSTLLKILTGVTTPTSGTISTEGEISALLELGTGFNPEYTGIENIYLNGTMRGYSTEEMKEKVEDIIDFADIGEYIYQPVKTYSSGMFARLAFSVMISFKPDILIVDEALSVGDVFFQQKCNSYMKNEMKDVTKILVTHDMNSIANMADRVILLDHGCIIKEGEPLEVIEDYLKMMHTEIFATSDIDETLDLTQSPETIYNSDWIKIEKSDIGGANEVIIEECCILVNGRKNEIVKPMDTVVIKAKFYCAKNPNNLIFGYTFKDKYGNSIFAQNTLGSYIYVRNLVKNSYYEYSLSFKWPEIKEGDYFLTLGIGEGEDQMIHTIQCWAHNIVHLKGIALKPMHGIINHTIDNFTITKV